MGQEITEGNGCQHTYFPDHDVGNKCAVAPFADGFTARALVQTFADLNEVREIFEGAKFRSRCTVTGFNHQYVQMENGSVMR